MSAAPEWFRSTNPTDDGEATPSPLDAVAEDERYRFQLRRNVALEDGLRQKDEVIAVAVDLFRQHGLHEEADRVERLGAPF